MLSFLYALIAGAAMSVQGAFNTRLSERTGLWEANAYVQATALALSLAAMALLGKGDIRRLAGAPWYAWLGGPLGIAITVTVMLAFAGLKPTLAVAVILLAQLAVAALIDALGLFGSEKTPFGALKWAGLALIAAGIVVFNLEKA